MTTLTIPLTQGKSTIIDEADYPLVAPYKFYALRYRSAFYAVTKICQPDGRRLVVGMHRIILDAPPDRWSDHINGDTLDNRRSNLRLVTPRENARNRKSPLHNTSGFKGVIWMRDRGCWRMQLQGRKGDEGKIIIDGFATPEEAARAYDTAARALWPLRAVQLRRGRDTLTPR